MIFGNNRKSRNTISKYKLLFFSCHDNFPVVLIDASCYLPSFSWNSLRPAFEINNIIYVIWSNEIIHTKKQGRRDSVLAELWRSRAGVLAELSSLDRRSNNNNRFLVRTSTDLWYIANQMLLMADGCLLRPHGWWTRLDHLPHLPLGLHPWMLLSGYH